MNTYPICDFTVLEKAWRSWNHRSYAWTDALSGMVFVPTQKAIRYSVNTCPICDFTIESSAVQHPCVTEITLKSRFLCANRSPIRYAFRAGAKAIRHSANVAQHLSCSFICLKVSPLTWWTVLFHQLYAKDHPGVILLDPLEPVCNLLDRTRSYQVMKECAITSEKGIIWVSLQANSSFGGDARSHARRTCQRRRSP